MKLSLLLCLVFAFVAPLRAEEFATFNLKNAEGQELKARLLSPAAHTGKVPLVVVLHGAGERGDDNEAQLKYGAPLFQKANEKFPCYVLVPQCPKDEKWVDWDWSKPFTNQPAEMTWPTKLVVQMIDQLPASWPDIDTDRIYLTGLSMGGYGTWDLITRFPDKFAAAVPICGGGDVTKAAPAAKVPVWAFHGADDPVVPVVQTRNMIEALEKAGASPLYSEYPRVGHGSWNDAYAEPELLPWLFAQRRGQPFVAFDKVAQPFSQPPSNQFPAAGPVQGGSWFRPLWQQRRSAWAKSAEADQGAIVFLGDSITQQWETLAADFPKHKVANRGISGDTTRGVLARLKGDVLDVHPKAVCLLIGTNDIGLGGDVEVAAENLKEIILALYKADQKMPVILCKIMPSTSKKFRPVEAINRLNKLIETIADGDPTITLVDTYTPFADEQGEAKPDIFPDLLHPNAAGYGTWKDILEPVFTKLGL